MAFLVAKVPYGGTTVSGRGAGQQPRRPTFEVVSTMEKARRSRELGLVIRQMEPLNLETPLDQVDSYLTPPELFYVRSHFRVPKLELTDYQLRIEGAVRNPVALRYDQLRAMPSETRVATLECAGNGRVFLVPQTAGAQWELGAVGNAEWTGVPLRALLERAGLDDDACEIVLEGGDRGTPTEPPVPPGVISYARSLQRDKAMQRRGAHRLRDERP